MPVSVTVAIVIPVWNRAATLGRAIESALEQGADDVVVVDDASTDASADVARGYPVRLVRHPEKTEHWVRALGPVYESLTHDYVIGMGADDVLYGRYAEVVKLLAGEHRPGVVFGDYCLLREGRLQTPLEVRRYGFSEPTMLTPEAARQRFSQTPAPRYECGVGAAIRRDQRVWLHDRECWRLGPWEDSFGYLVAAIRAGCLYVPDVYAGFTVQQSEKSYHQKILLDQDARLKYLEICREWLNRPEILEYTAGIPFAI